MRTNLSDYVYTDFLTLSEAQDYAKSIHSEVHMYTRRAGQDYWDDLGVWCDAIHPRPDWDDYSKYERIEHCYNLFAFPNELYDYFHNVVSVYLDDNWNDAWTLEQTIKKYIEILYAVDNLEDDEVVAVYDDFSFEVIKDELTHGSYDAMEWQLGVPFPQNEDEYVD